MAHAMTATPKPPAIPAAQRESWARMLARLVPEATCLGCGGEAPRDGMHRCPACRAKAEETA